MSNLRWDPRRTVVAQGITVADVDELSLISVRACRRFWAHDLSEGMAVARTAILAALVTKPDDGADLRTVLIAAGRAAVVAEWQKRLSMYGCADYYSARRGVASMPRFNQFWSDYLGRNPTGHEDALVDRLALSQILPLLKADHRQALITLAETGSYSAAADLLGIGYHTLLTRVSRGRRQFLALWHEHEQPSRLWGVDRRTGKDGQLRTSTTSSLASVLRRRQQGRQARAARHTTSAEVADV